MRTVVALLIAVASLPSLGLQPITVFMIGDSTMADKPNPETNPERGWGQLLPKFVDDSVRVVNRAVNGRSTKSFIDEGRWESVLTDLRPGDYVFIQFGHNDEKREDSTRFADARTTYRRNLARFVTDARAKRAFPILFTPIVRRKFSAAGTLEDTHGDYPAAVRDVARSLDVPLVDLTAATAKLVGAAGPDSSKSLYVWVAPGAFALYPDGRQDDTHLSVRGATEVARIAASAVARFKLPLARHVRMGSDP